ncbi:MAG: 2-oxoglutarate ferredoxin oxidoreductase subunit beta [Chloroflexi bacterium]|nr:2-oxoglutarate ferredoxin oxidoreductase subunit beta [Chloroflexota bacterium]
MWCPGCGIGTIVGAMLRAIDRLALNQEDIVVVTGIGCSGIIYNYLRFDGFHGMHGRALAVATGIKIANPRLQVIVPMGDGDCAAIGGNHFIHAARRNIDLTAIVINNQIYGMTGGQSSPTTLRQSRTSTAPKGHLERPFDVCELARGAGATYIARGIAGIPIQLVDLLANAMSHKGFSVVEVLSQCPVQAGRRNGCADAWEMLRWLKGNTVSSKRAAGDGADGKLAIGELLNVQAPEWTEEYDRILGNNLKT